MRWALLLILLVELAVGGFMIHRYRSVVRPRLPDLSLVDKLTADDIRNRVSRCVTAKDWVQVAGTYMATGFFAEAESCYRYAASLEPENAAIRFQWGFCLSRLGRLEESNEQFEQAAELGYPEPERAWYFVGRNHLRGEAPQSARAAFTKAAGLPAADYENARIAYRQGNLAEAKQLLAGVLRVYPNKAEPNLLAYQIAVAEGDAKAQAKYHDAHALGLERMPTPFGEEHQQLVAIHDHLGPLNYYQQARQAVAAGDYDQAERLYKTVLEVKWEPTALDLLAEIELGRGKKADPDTRQAHFATAEKYIREIVDKAGPSTQYLWRLGEVLALADKLDEASKAWSTAADLRTEEDVAGLYKNLATAAKDKASKQRFTARMLYHRGMQRFWHRAFEDAKEDLREATKIDPSLAHAWYYLGEANRLAGRKREAVDAYRQCLKQQPYHGRAMARIASLER